MTHQQRATAFDGSRKLALRATLGAFADVAAAPAMKSPLLGDAQAARREQRAGGVIGEGADSRTHAAQLRADRASPQLARLTSRTRGRRGGLPPRVAPPPPRLVC